MDYYGEGSLLGLQTAAFHGHTVVDREKLKHWHIL
jgi:hypothetical protein